MRACTKPGRTDFYEYIILYVEDVLCIINKPQEVINCIKKFFLMQPGSIEKPDIYIGAKVSKIVIPSGVVAWTLIASKYDQ